METFGGHLELHGNIELAGESFSVLSPRPHMHTRTQRLGAVNELGFDRQPLLGAGAREPRRRQAEKNGSQRRECSSRPGDTRAQHSDKGKGQGD